MPDTDDHPATPTPSRPSLLGAAETSPRARPVNDPGQMRMLDELEAVVRPRAVERSSAPPGWLIALLAGGVAIAAAMWWVNHKSGERPAAPAAVATSVPALAKPAPVAVAAVAASAPAIIETIAAVPREPALATNVEDSASSPATPPAMPVTASPAPRQPVRSPAAVAAATPAPARAVAATRKTDEKVTTVVTASGGKWTVTVAEPASAEASPATAAPPLANPAEQVTRSAAGRETKGDDADVKLLSALLAHVARSGPGGALAEEGQLTIAQLVKRCDARPADEVRECRRRICEGYWGKAEACPAPVPAKKG